MIRTRSIAMLTAVVALIIVLGQPIAFAEEKYSMTYLYSGKPSNYIALVDESKGAFNSVSPNYFNLRDDGSLVITSAFDPNFVNEMHKRNVKVLPFLSNHWDKNVGRNALTNREELATNLVKFINENNLDGLHVDLEGLNETDRESFTDFIKILSEKMPANKNLAVAVAANPKGFTKGWHGMYDYGKLAAYADYLMIMAYDESWDGSAPGPVASYSFSKGSIDFALKNNVPNSKIVMGIPLYGRIWNLADVTTTPTNRAIIKGSGISLYKIEPLLTMYNAKTEYVKEKETMKATFTINEGDPTYKLYEWSKEPLPPGNYEVWYENSETIKRKIDLVHQYNIKGIGSWSLGQEDSSIWPLYNTWMDGKDFEDVPLNHWAFLDISNAKDNGWLQGRSSILFAPEGSLKRSEAAAILVRFLGLTMDEPYASPFVDVKANYWGKNDIEIARQHGLLMGRTANKFAPEESVSREEMATMLSRLLKEKEIETAGRDPYPDVLPEDWSYGVVMDMSAKGVFSGFKDGTYRPKEKVTRAQMATLLTRISQYF